MKRTQYWLRDLAGDIRAIIKAPEGEAVVLEDNLRYNIEVNGWELEKWEVRTVGEPVQIHGHADWKSVADQLAPLMREILFDPTKWWGTEIDEDLRDQVTEAVMSYDIATLEVMVAAPDPDRDQREEEL